MKAIFRKWFIVLCACKQNQEPREEEAEEVEVDQVEAIAAQDTAKDMTDETVRISVEESGNSVTEMEETVDTVDDTASPHPTLCLRTAYRIRVKMWNSIE